MASIIDSFRETFEDRCSFFKLIIFAIPVYYGYTMTLPPSSNISTAWTIGIVTAFFFLGYFAKITNNVLNEKDKVLPQLNFLKITISSIKTLIAIGPLTFIFILLANSALGFLSNIPVEWFVTLFQIIIWLIVSSISLTSFLLYVRKENLAEAYNIKIIIEKSG